MVVGKRVVVWIKCITIALALGKILLKENVFLLGQKQRPAEVRLWTLQKAFFEKDLEKRQEIASNKKISVNSQSKINLNKNCKR